MRPRRPHDDAARRRARAGAAPQLRRYRALHLPAGGGERGRRPRDGAGGPVRPVPDEGCLRHAQLARAAGRAHRVARRPADGRLRHLRDRRDRPRRARGDAAPGPRPDAVRRARDQRAADDRRAQPAPARRRRRQRHAGARRRHVERDPAGGRAARHGALVRAGRAGFDRAQDGRDRHGARRDIRHDGDTALRATLSGHDQHAGGDAARARGGHSAGRRSQHRHQSDAVDGLRGLRVHAAGEARLLRVVGRRPRARHAEPAQPALRLQRRGTADRRELLGDAGGAAVAGTGGSTAAA